MQNNIRYTVEEVLRDVAIITKTGSILQVT